VAKKPCNIQPNALKSIEVGWHRACITGNRQIPVTYAHGYNPGMHDIPSRIADVLFEIESILRAHGRWDSNQPAVAELSSREPFCLDTLRFEQWLQWIFLPRMKQILEHGKPLPRKSGIHVYAQEYLQKKDPPTTRLLMHIKRFDDLITIQSGVRRH
jgi:uncharacterized protein YqcC (DUF446 family)